MLMLVSIVIPTRNRVRQLRRALESCVRQSYQNFEVIVVDDGSENTEYLDLIRNDFPSYISFFTLPENRGGSYARNFGVTKAKGDFVLFLDSDDELDSDALKIHLDFRAKDEKLAQTITYGRGQRISIDKTGTRTVGEIYPFRGLKLNERIGEYLFSLEGKIFTPSMMIPRGLLDILKFNEKLRRHQDYGFVFDASLRHQIKFHYIDQVVFYWISDFEDEGSRQKGVSLHVSRDFLQLYGTVMTKKERSLYLKNIASSVAVASRDFGGFYKLCRTYDLGDGAIHIALISFFNAFAKRAYVKLFKR